MSDRPRAPCCAPGRGSVTAADPARHASTDSDATDGMVRLSDCRFRMGSDDPAGYPADGEGPVREVRLGDFWIDRCVVSNAEFREFANATGHVTDADAIGWSFVFAGLLPDDFAATRGVAHAPWWRQVHGASWDHPEGPQSGLDGRDRHPVVHVSWRDATSYAAWVGKQLPSEAEWEYAARGGLDQQRFPWGDDLTLGDEHRSNVWQGEFPAKNRCEDGYYGTAPVDAYRPNGHGLHNTTGNVWEWCADWFSTSYHASGPRTDPSGPPAGSHKLIKGGSYLCHDSYCNRYRVAARSANTADSTTGHTGFRCARSVGQTGV